MLLPENVGFQNDFKASADFKLLYPTEPLEDAEHAGHKHLSSLLMYTV